MQSEPAFGGHETARAKMARHKREAEEIPDFEAEAQELRSYYDEAAALYDRSAEETLRCLARTRRFYGEARCFRVEFDRVSKLRGIKAGRIETKVIRWFFKIDPHNRSTVNRRADALVWLTEHTQGKSLERAVQLANKVGGLTAIAEIERKHRETRAREAEALRKAPEVTLTEIVDSALERREPTVPTVEKCTEDRVSLFLCRERRGATPELYGPISEEKLIRAALKLLPAL